MNKNFRTTFWILPFAVLLLSCYPRDPIPVGPVQTTILSTGFESPSTYPWGFLWAEGAQKSYSMQTVDSKYRKGIRSLRVELRKGDLTPDNNLNVRAELTAQKEKPRMERRYKFSIYLPENGDEDFATDISPEILAQWHNVPDPGEEWTSPPLALAVRNGEWSVDRLWDEDSISTTAKMFAEKKYAFHNLGSVQGDKGKWTDWEFYVKWGWLPEHNTILEVYKNGVKVLDQKGLPNTTNDRDGVYFKMGIYKWEWGKTPSPSTTSKRIVYYDDVEIKEYTYNN